MWSGRGQVLGQVLTGLSRSCKILAGSWPGCDQILSGLGPDRSVTGSWQVCRGSWPSTDRLLLGQWSVWRWCYRASSGHCVDGRRQRQQHADGEACYPPDGQCQTDSPCSNRHDSTATWKTRRMDQEKHPRSEQTKISTAKEDQMRLDRQSTSVNSATESRDVWACPATTSTLSPTTTSSSLLRDRQQVLPRIQSIGEPGTSDVIVAWSSAGALSRSRFSSETLSPTSADCEQPTCARSRFVVLKCPCGFRRSLMWRRWWQLLCQHPGVGTCRLASCRWCGSDCKDWMHRGQPTPLLADEHGALTTPPGPMTS